MMMSQNLFTAFTVSVLALAVIFLVLGILIFVIKALVRVLPYKETKTPQKTKPGSAPPANTEEEEYTVAIHAAIAAHSGKQPHQIQITNINAI